MKNILTYFKRIFQDERQEGKSNTNYITVQEIIDIFEIHDQDNYKGIVAGLPSFNGEEKSFILRVLNDCISSLPTGWKLYNSLREKSKQIIDKEALSDNQKINEIGKLL